jgi:REP-associated tyrosine transposase
MRNRRLKIDSKVGSSVQHLTSRTNNGEYYFNRREKAKLLALARQAAEFCGLDLLTYAMMVNHPHLSALTPFWRIDPDDAEILRRYRVLNPGKVTKYRSKRIEVIEAHLEAGTPEGIEWRRRQLAQMGDISQFMKIVKQRFTVWFNRVHHRSGTIWGGRFKNMLVEEDSDALLAMAAYIDLNPVRAGIVRDPKDYPFTGYAEAVAGSAIARRGIMEIVDLPTWELAQAEYRKLLYSIGSKPRVKGRAMTIEEFEKVAAKGGKLTLAEALCCRIRRFTDSLILGSAEFVAAHMEAFCQANNRKRRPVPCPMPAVTDWGGLTTLRRLRGP